MNRVEYVKDFELGFPSERLTLFSALVSCLDGEETCEVLDTTFEQGWNKRQVILRGHLKTLKSCGKIVIAVLQKPELLTKFGGQSLCPDCREKPIGLIFAKPNGDG